MVAQVELEMAVVARVTARAVPAAALVALAVVVQVVAASLA